MTSPSEPARRHGPSRRRAVIEWLVIVVIALVFSLLVRTFIFQTFSIPSKSMNPTLKKGDRIVVRLTRAHLSRLHDLAAVLNELVDDQDGERSADERRPTGQGTAG